MFFCGEGPRSRAAPLGTCGNALQEGRRCDSGTPHVPLFPRGIYVTLVDTREPAAKVFAVDRRGMMSAVSFNSWIHFLDPLSANP